VSLRDAGQAITGCKSNAHFLVWESVFFQVLSHQGESDCGSDVALPLHPAVIGTQSLQSQFHKSYSNFVKKPNIIV
jgi:hypothetical protein